jgi:pimeloyl-ACP methyl ester carboxylesterase
VAFAESRRRASSTRLHSSSVPIADGPAVRSHPDARDVAPLHRGGSGTPLVLLHGLTGTWRVWQPLLPALEREHEVLALTLPGHRYGPRLDSAAPVSIGALADGVERVMDAENVGTAHLAGNSLGGWLAIELGRRGRARSVTALSPAGGWQSPRDLRRVIRHLSAGQVLIDRRAVLRLDHLVRRPRFRRLAFRQVMEHGQLVPAADAIAMLEAAAECAAFRGFVEWVRNTEPLQPAEPAPYRERIAWSEHDRTIPFRRFGAPLLRALAGAEHVTLPGVGHVPMFDDPRLVAQTILDVTRNPRSMEQI